MPVKITLALLLALSAAPGSAQFTPQELTAAQQNPAAFTIDDKTLRIENLGPAATAVAPAPAPESGTILLPILDHVINIGSKLWKIVEDNRPVVDTRSTYAMALPEGVTSARALAGWHPPQGTVYSLTAKNGYGSTVVKARYQVLRAWGGSYDGRGKYLTAVTIQPLLVEVAWGYHFAMDASVPDESVVNVGTGQDPVAGMIARIGWRIQTALKDSQGQGLYYLQGDGVFQQLGGPFDKGPAEAATRFAKLAEDRLSYGL